MKVLVLLLGLHVLIPTALYAADFCVSSIDEMYSAIAAVDAGQPGEVHHVKIVSGDYFATDYLGFGPNGSLTLDGGYDAGCMHKSLGSSGTVIHDARADEFHDISIHAFGGSLAVSDLTFLNFSPVFIFPQGIGHELAVARTAFALATEHGYVEMHTEGGAPMHLENVLVDGTNPDCTMLASTSEMDFVTIVNRGSGNSLCMFGDLVLKNSIAYSVSGADISLQPNTLLYAAASVFDEVDGDIDPLSTDNIPGPVTFEATNDPIYRNRPANIPEQIARDSGLELPLIETDILGNLRVVGTAPDRGAFELQSLCDLLFRGAFDSNDSCRPLGHSKHARPTCSSCP